MIFNSIEFSYFLVIVFVLYWFFKNNFKKQNIILLISSYVFYGWWDYRFLFLIAFSTVVDFFLAKKISKIEHNKKRKFYLSISVFINIGLLFFFKYYNFFLDTFIESFTFFGTSISANRLNIILPVGISFYTFQTLSYTIDVYRNKLKATNNFIAFASFVSFFPQLVAGPIERATNLLPKFTTFRHFTYKESKLAVQLIVWGFFKKLVIADNAAVIVDGIFSNYDTQSSLSLWVGAILFSFQIYADFSGYSDIAIGTAKLFGIDLMTNFKFPYFSKNLIDFWRRWHISLSTWFRDYVYFPLGGSKQKELITVRNIAIVFLISGFWHGANWTFIFWGTIHAFIFIVVFYFKKYLPKFQLNFFSTMYTFFVVTIAWVFFRANTIATSFNYVQKMFTFSSGKMFSLTSNKYLLITSVSFLAILILLGVERYFYRKDNDQVTIHKYGLVLIILIISFFGAFKNHNNFIYFQF